jgi:hypothetical protein
MPSLREELCCSSASLVDEASEARRHNKDASDFIGELCYASASLLNRASETHCHNKRGGEGH